MDPIKSRVAELLSEEPVCILGFNQIYFLSIPLFLISVCVL